MTEIVFASDNQYLPYLPCNLTQIARYGRRAAGVTLVVPADAPQEQLRVIRDTASLSGIRLDVVELTVLSEMHKQGLIHTGQADSAHVSHFTFAKLLLPELLSHLDEALYLDIDTMVRAPLDELLTWELRHPIGAVEEYTGGPSVFETRRFSYFNAGVLRLSLAQLRKEQFLSRATHILLAQPSLPLLDQDVFNILFQGRVDILPYSYNVSDWAAEQFPVLFNSSNSSIVHFWGAKKPWLPSSSSVFSREWQRDYGRLALEVTNPPTQGSLGPRPAQRPKTNNVMLSLARRVLPSGAKRFAKSTSLRILDEVQQRSTIFKQRLEGGFRTPRELAVQRLPGGVAKPSLSNNASVSPDCGLDLLISSARSGTNALGSIIERERPDVHYMHELYLGSRHGLRNEELNEEFPWFADRNFDFLTGEVPAGNQAFTALMSSNAVEITRSVMGSRPGRTLIKVFPDQLHPYAVEAVMATFRPRVLILRRELIFSYVSLLKAMQVRSFQGADTTGVTVEFSERQALSYARKCHIFFDRAALLADGLGLNTVALTYSGLFSTGVDISKLSAFYPGSAWPINPETGGLAASLPIQDRRTDASTLAMIKSVCALSAEAQAHMLRLPGFFLT